MQIQTYESMQVYTHVIIVELLFYNQQFNSGEACMHLYTFICLCVFGYMYIIECVHHLLGVSIEMYGT
jgi:hypothetical protein